ncbi:MAG: ABC transporter ATP-binding protein [Bacilli bacterium]
MLQLIHVEKYYGARGHIVQALSDVNFTVTKGEFVAIMGPSGSGKTTLLNCIATIDSVSAGQIVLGAQDVTKLRGKALDDCRTQQLGFIFQDFQLLDTLTVYENIALPLSLQKAKHIHEKVEETARKLAIEELLQRYPYELSGGQKQRVAAARAMIGEPALLLADEPTGALDSKSSRQLMNWMRTMNEETATTVVLVTHDPFAASFAERILFLKDGRLFTELVRGDRDRAQFFDAIVGHLTFLGGDTGDEH